MAVRFRTGEPYELAGRRLVFTNWRFIRPGHLRWNDDEGRNVSVDGDEGPLDAHFRFTEGAVRNSPSRPSRPEDALAYLPRRTVGERRGQCRILAAR